MTVTVKFDIGETVTYEDTSAVDIVNYPPRDTPADGYIRVREYPPEYVRTTSFRPNVIGNGTLVLLASGVRTVVEVSHE